MKILKEIGDVIDNGKEVDRNHLTRYIMVLRIYNILISDFSLIVYLFAINFFFSCVLFKFDLKGITISAIIIFCILKIFLKKDFEVLKSAKKEIVEGINYLKEKRKLLIEKKLSN